MRARYDVLDLEAESTHAQLSISEDAKTNELNLHKDCITGYISSIESL